MLLSERVRGRGIFDVAGLERRLRHGRRDGGLGLDLWTLLSFELWCRRFLDEPRVLPRESRVA